MDNGIYEANDSFDFNKLLLIKPVITSGNNFFIRYLFNDAPIYIQPPKCILKEGFIKSGKRIYCDLVFSNENVQFIQWMEDLENTTQRKIFENREKWFETELELHDIENSFTSALRIYKSGKNYILRVSVPCVLGKCNLKIYNEDEEEILPENLKENENVFAIVEFKGIKCSSRSFQIDIELKQLMILKPQQIFDRCILKSNNKNHLGNNNDTVSDKNRYVGDAINILQSDRSVINDIQEPVSEEKDVVETIDIPEETFSKISAETVLSPSPEEDNKIDSKTPDVTNGENKKTIETNDMETNVNMQNTELSENKIIAGLTDDHMAEPNSENLLQEIDFNLDDLPVSDTIEIKDRNDMYYQMYSEALTRAKMARDLALSNYLQSKNITNSYLLTEIKDDDIEDM